MNRGRFMKIVYGVREYDDYFMAKQDCTDLWGFTSIQKCTAAIRCLAYGAPPDIANHCLRMTESICSHTLYRLCRAVIAVFAKDYLRAPKADDTARILGIYKGHTDECSVILEAVADHDLWIWYYLADDIYPMYATFVKTIPSPASEIDAYFATCQEAARKDVEHDFGVLQHVSPLSDTQLSLGPSLRCGR
ncbi:uncharacterized protein [Lolium perenne]|uniref:uncharacterized protein n=1 Tax=Lolium perenne TaxID=4522 RepID=UPI003A98EBB4